MLWCLFAGWQASAGVVCTPGSKLSRANALTLRARMYLCRLRSIRLPGLNICAAPACWYFGWLNGYIVDLGVYLLCFDIMSRRWPTLPHTRCSPTTHPHLLPGWMEGQPARLTIQPTTCHLAHFCQATAHTFPTLPPPLHTSARLAGGPACTPDGQA